MAELFGALIHYPVLNRHGAIVTSAVTSLDLHDLARSAMTFGMRAVYIVHPVAEQRAFAERVRDHWLTHPERAFDSRRREALTLLVTVPDLEQARTEVQAHTGFPPLLVYTSARAKPTTTYSLMRKLLAQPGPPVLLMFGTAFGLAPELARSADLVLPPINGLGDYNHLSVRAAAAIILDRLRGR